MKKISSAAIFLATIFLSATANANWLNGTIDWIDVEPTYIRVTLTSTVGGGTCSSGSVEWSYPDQNYMKSILAVLLSAQARQAPIRWYDCGCLQSNTILAACSIMSK